MPPIVARPYVRMFLRVDVVDEVEAVIFVREVGDETVGWNFAFLSVIWGFWIDE